MNENKNNDSLEVWEKPSFKIININETNNGESDLLSEGSFWGWLFGSGHS